MDTYQPAEGTPPGSIQPPRPRPAVPPRVIIMAGVAVLLLIVAAIVGHAISSSNSIAVGDCVQTNPSALSGWSIKKVSCGSDQGDGFTVQKVVSVMNGTSGDCGFEYTTFEDDPNNQVYCLENLYG